MLGRNSQNKPNGFSIHVVLLSGAEIKRNVESHFILINKPKNEIMVMTFPLSFSKQISNKDHSWCEISVIVIRCNFFSLSSAERSPSNLQITGYKYWSAHAQCGPTVLGFHVWLQIMFCSCIKQTMLFSFFSLFSRFSSFFW